jgi:hypothetical protein
MNIRLSFEKWAMKYKGYFIWDRIYWRGYWTPICRLWRKL